MLARLARLGESRDAVRKHLAETGDSFLRGKFQQSPQRWERDLRDCARESAEALAADAAPNRRAEVLASSPGAGSVHVAALLAIRPERGQLGGAPCARDSGGRALARGMLYLAAVAAVERKLGVLAHTLRWEDRLVPPETAAPTGSRPQLAGQLLIRAKVESGVFPSKLLKMLEI